MLGRPFGMLVAIALLAASQPSQANNVVGIRAASLFLKGSGFDAISSNDQLVQVELNYARQVLDLWEGSLWVEGSWAGGPKQSSLFGDKVKTKALLQTITVGVRYMLPVWSWFVPYVRFGVGVLVGTFELTPEGASPLLDRSAAFCGQVLAGFELLWPRRRVHASAIRMTGGLAVEAGYGFSSRLGFDLAPADDGDVRRIPLQGTDLGALDLNGAQLRVGVVMHF